MSGDGTIKIFAGSASKEFAAQMCDYLGSPMGKCTTHIFSEGNTFVRIDESIRDKDVYFVQTLGLDPNNEFTELLSSWTHSSVPAQTVLPPLSPISAMPRAIRRTSPEFQYAAGCARSA